MTWGRLPGAFFRVTLESSGARWALSIQVTAAPNSAIQRLFFIGTRIATARACLFSVLEWGKQMVKPSDVIAWLRTAKTLGDDTTMLTAAAELIEHAQPQTEDLSTQPWKPMDNPIDIKHMGKLLEETGELGAIAARCLIQGMDGKNPETGKLNSIALEDEIADILVNTRLVQEHFDLDAERVLKRAEDKYPRLRAWHLEANIPAGKDFAIMRWTTTPEFELQTMTIKTRSGRVVVLKEVSDVKG